MDVRVAEAKNRLTELIRVLVEQGEPVVITGRGKPVAQLTALPVKRRRVIFGGMKDRIELLRDGTIRSPRKNCSDTVCERLEFLCTPGTPLRVTLSS